MELPTSLWKEEVCFVIFDDYGWTNGANNIDDKEGNLDERNIDAKKKISDRPMVIATIKEESALQLNSSADIYIHNVTLNKLAKPRRCDCRVSFGSKRFLRLLSKNAINIEFEL